MNLFAKILVVVVLLLSTAFAVAQMTLHSKREMYRQKYETKTEELKETKATLEEKSEALSQLQSTLDQVKREKSSQINDLKEEKDSLQLRVRKLDKDNESKESVIQENRNRISELGDRVEHKNNIIKGLEDKISQLDGKLKNSLKRIENLQDTVQSKKSDINSLNDRLANLRDEKKQAMERIEDMQGALSQLEARGVHIPGRVVPSIDASVIRVDREVGAVVLNKGKNAGVEVGFAFTIYKDANFIARAYVMEVYEDYSLARVDKEISDTTKIEQGYNATTRIGILD